MKNTVKLNESHLRRIITESVKSVIKEYGYDSNPQSGYECFFEIGEKAAYNVMRELKQYNGDIDEKHWKWFLTDLNTHLKHYVRLAMKM